MDLNGFLFLVYLGSALCEYQLRERKEVGTAQSQARAVCQPVERAYQGGSVRQANWFTSCILLYSGQL